MAGLVFLVALIIISISSFVDAVNCTRGNYNKNGACTPCPRGRYGSTDGLTSPLCTAACPIGKYNDMLGAKTDDDCRLCPVGFYGATAGLTRSSCSGACPAGKFSSKFGLTTIAGCADCPKSYFEWQCNLGAKDKRYTGGILPPRAPNS